MAHKSSSIVVSLKRGLDVLRAFHARDIALNNSELVNRTGLPKSTVARFTYTLSRLGYLQHDEDQANYRLGNKAVGPGQVLLSTLPVCQLAQPFMHAFADKHGASLVLAAAHENQMACLVHCAAETAARRFHTGAILSMAHTAIGRSYLWALGPGRQSEHFALIAGEAAESADQLLSEINESFKQLDAEGYCYRSNEWRGEAFSVACPIVLTQEDTVLSLGCSLSHQKAGQELSHEQIGAELVALSAEISNAMADAGLTFWSE